VYLHKIEVTAHVGSSLDIANISQRKIPADQEGNSQELTARVGPEEGGKPLPWGGETGPNQVVEGEERLLPFSLTTTSRTKGSRGGREKATPGGG